MTFSSALDWRMSKKVLDDLSMRTDIEIKVDKISASQHANHAKFAHMASMTTSMRIATPYLVFVCTTVELVT